MFTGARNVSISVLDNVPIREGHDAADAVRNATALAQLAERLGYKRYWFTEHHNSPGVGSSSPPVLTAQVAALTRTIRVGAGGVMLPNHAPIVVAEQFGTLEAAHPGRIDLGLGRARGTDPMTARAIGREEHGDQDFPRQVFELFGFFCGAFPEDHPYADLTAVPARGNLPEVWILGSSTNGAKVAAFFGLPFSFAYHFSPQNAVAATQAYRSEFRPSPYLDRPRVMVSVSVICADTDDRAQWLAGSGRLSSLRARGERRGPLPSPERAAEHVYSEEQLATVNARSTGRQIAGGPDTVGERLVRIVKETAADELMVTSPIYYPDDRARSYELVADLVASARSHERAQSTPVGGAE